MTKNNKYRYTVIFCYSPSLVVKARGVDGGSNSILYTNLQRVMVN